MPKTVIYANLLPFIAVFFVMLFVRINPLFDKKQNKLFFLSAMAILYMLVIISVDYTISLESYRYGWLIRRIASFFHFSFSCAVPIFLIQIFTNKKMNKFLYLPAAVNLVLCFISMFVNLVFYIPFDGGYERGPLFFVPSLITGFYMVVLMVASIVKRHVRPYEALFLIGVFLGLMLAMYLEIAEYYRFLSWDFAAIFLILYYLLLNINKSKIDPLTGANNRAMYVQRTESLNRNRGCMIAMIDINGFKAINDEKGHQQGDKLLVEFVSCFDSFADKSNILYRIGGDEFAILSEEVSMEKFQMSVEAFLNKLKEHGINCAVGFESYDPAGEIENAIRSADMKMYEDKRQYHSDTTRQ